MDKQFADAMHQPVLLSRIDKRIALCSEKIAAFGNSLRDMKPGKESVQRVGSIGVSTRYTIDDVKYCQDQINTWSAALADWRKIRKIVEEAR